MADDGRCRSRRGALRRGAPAILALLVTGLPACGKSSSAPTPQYPALTGAWSGTLTILPGAGRATPVPNVCTHSWNVTSQSAGTFSGTALTAGSCRTTAGTVSGSVSQDGTLSLGGGVLPLDDECIRLSGGAYAGTVAASELSAEMTESVQCMTPGDPSPFAFVRTIRLALRR